MGERSGEKGEGRVTRATKGQRQTDGNRETDIHLSSECVIN